MMRPVLASLKRLGPLGVWGRVVWFRTLEHLVSSRWRREVVGSELYQLATARDVSIAFRVARQDTVGVVCLDLLDSLAVRPQTVAELQDDTGRRRWYVETAAAYLLAYGFARRIGWDLLEITPSGAALLLQSRDDEFTPHRSGHRIALLGSMPEQGAACASSRATRPGSG